VENKLLNMEKGVILRHATHDIVKRECHGELVESMVGRPPAPSFDMLRMTFSYVILPFETASFRKLRVTNFGI
jgi:hypothetical protein